MATTTGRTAVGTGLAMELVLDVSPSAPSTARAGLRRWLESLRWPPDDTEPLVFCVSEAVTNIVQHAYRSAGPVQLAARLETLTDPGQARRLRWICIDIHDNGRWRDPDPHRPGIGLWMLRRLLDNLVVITRGRPDYGTTVSLRSNPSRRSTDDRRCAEPRPECRTSYNRCGYAPTRGHRALFDGP